MGRGAGTGGVRVRVRVGVRVGAGSELRQGTGEGRGRRRAARHGMYGYVRQAGVTAGGKGRVLVTARARKGSPRASRAAAA